MTIIAPPHNRNSLFGHILRSGTGGAQIITAVIRPVMSPLFDGEAMEDVANWAAFIDDSATGGNYASSAAGGTATIASVVIAYTGDAIDASTALSAGDLAGFTATATDSEGNVWVFTAFPITVQDVAPAEDAAPSISGDLYKDDNLTGTSGTFTGTNLTESDEWEVSDDGATGWTGTGDTDTTSPALVLGKYYRFASTATNSAGSVTTYSDVLGPIVEAPTAATVDSVTAGTWTGSAQPFTVAATGAEDDDGVYWVVVPNAATDPINTEVRAGQANGGGSPTDDGNDLWPGPFSDTLASGIPNGSYKLCVVIDNGALSNVGVSSAFTVDTTASVLATPLVSESSGDIDWSVTSNEGNGEVYAGLRLSSDPVLSDTNIINGTGDAVDTDSDDTPAADDTNGGSFLSPAAGTYRVDMVQVDDYGNVSNVVTSAEVTIAAAAAGPQVNGTPTNVYSSTSTTDTGGTGSSITAAAGSNRLILAMVSYVNNSTAPSTISPVLGAQGFALAGTLGSTTPAIPKVQWFYIREADIPAGSQAFGITFDQTVQTPNVTLIELTDVDQSTTIGSTSIAATLTTESSTSDDITTTATNSLVITGFALGTAQDQAFTVGTDSGGSVTQLTQHELTIGYGQGTACYENISGSGVTVTHDCSWTPTASRWGTRPLEILAA